MAIIMRKPTDDKEITVMSDGKKYWLTFTKAGEWEVYVKLTAQQATRLHKEFDIDLHVDDGMTGPD